MDYMFTQSFIEKNCTTVFQEQTFYQVITNIKRKVVIFHDQLLKYYIDIFVVGRIDIK